MNIVLLHIFVQEFNVLCLCVINAYLFIFKNIYYNIKIKELLHINKLISLRLIK